MVDDTSGWKLPWDGGCRCGATRFRIGKAPLISMACHCAGCQSMSASAFSLSIAVPSDGFEVTAGEPVYGGLAQDQHLFCPTCKTWMFTRPKEVDWLVNVRATLLDEHGWFEPFIETFTDEKLPWSSTSARHNFPKLPEMSEFEPLMQGFALEAARP
jgi:hypothetical protein